MLDLDNPWKNSRRGRKGTDCIPSRLLRRLGIVKRPKLNGEPSNGGQDSFVTKGLYLVGPLLSIRGIEVGVEARVARKLGDASWKRSEQIN